VQFGCKVSRFWKKLLFIRVVVDMSLQSLTELVICVLYLKIVN
jgi:hypothetical protein